MEQDGDLYHRALWIQAGPLVQGQTCGYKMGPPLPWAG